MKSLSSRLERISQKIEYEEHWGLLNAGDLANEVKEYNKETGKHLTIEKVKKEWKFDSQTNVYYTPGFIDRVIEEMEEEN